MRLIDADELKYCHITKAIISPMGCAMTKIVNLDDIPTAFDKEEVIRQIRKEGINVLNDSDGYMIDRAVEIVKGGGLNG